MDSVGRPSELSMICGEAIRTGWLSPAAAERLQLWLCDEQYAEHHASIRHDLHASRWAELDAAFGTILPFGTGGRRGPMGAYGTATINRRTIAESAYGLAEYLLEVHADRSAVQPPVVVIACDSRHRSLEFARLSAEVCASAGCRVKLFAEPRATPELSFAVRHLRADAGIVISASHNPPGDNGFKAYWSNGGQIVPPHDTQILSRIARISTLPPITERVGESDRIELLGESIDEAYLDALAGQSLVSLTGDQCAGLKLLYTPLHGVGASSAGRILKRVGFTNMELFEPQSSLDGAFPNVRDHLPNPERDEVFTEAIESARGRGFDLILATDPDADRLRVAVRVGSEGATSHDEWVLLSGNQLGALLVDFALTIKTWPEDAYVVQTMVTSPLISRIARARNVRVIDKLPVGFKYIGETIDAEGPAGFIFGAEESLGYLAGDYARDKDAALAALWTAELAAWLKSRGETLLDRLRANYAEHGLHVESLWPIRQFAGNTEGSVPATSPQQVVEQIRLRMAALRKHPPVVPREQSSPSEEIQWQRMDDLLLRTTITLEGEGDSQTVTTRELTEPYPVADMCWLFGQARDESNVTLALRPSGTEPLLKIYLFTILPPKLWEGEDPLARREVEARQHGNIVRTFLSLHFAGESVLAGDASSRGGA
ncbi:MAG: phospho-sugar mutase [Planctomyces sp.]|nr:phospho-sugar mutase [Planctomyces sp.]